MDESYTLSEDLNVQLSIAQESIAFPDLRLVPVKSLVPHEFEDPHRASKLIERIGTDGVLQNPIIVRPLDENGQEFIVLDGANRTNALLKMGVQHALVQVFAVDDPGLNLTTWNQVVSGLSSHELMRRMKLSSNLLLDLGQIEDVLVGDEYLPIVQIHLSEVDVFNAYTANDESTNRIRAINQLVDTIKKDAIIHRTHIADMRMIKDIYNEVAALLVFCNLSLNDISRTVKSGQLLPAGITRFTVSPRALRVNYPLSELKSTIPLREKNEKLIQWINVLFSKKRIRIYNEATIMFDE